MSQITVAQTRHDFGVWIGVSGRRFFQLLLHLEPFPFKCGNRIRNLALALEEMTGQTIS